MEIHRALKDCMLQSTNKTRSSIMQEPPPKRQKNLNEEFHCHDGKDKDNHISEVCTEYIQYREP